VSTSEDKLVLVGEEVTKTLRYTREDIAKFAHMTFDSNPLHIDVEVARRARFGDVIAAGQHTSAIMMGLVATYFSRSDDGIAREMLCLNFNFSYKQPVFADEDIHIVWRVSAVSRNSKLGGMLAHLDGSAAASPTKPSVIGRGTILVKHAELVN
jgi:acyl dehydratase